MTISVLDSAGTTRTIKTADEVVDSVDALLSPVRLVGTRAYNYAGIQRVSVASAAADSSAITGTEVMVYASVKCYILPGASGNATVSNGIPVEAGEKFHFRITSGHKISV